MENENDILVMARIYIAIFILFLNGTLSGQTLKHSPSDRWLLGVGTTLNSHSYEQGDNHIYTELTIDYKFKEYFSGGIYVGHQKRNYLFPAATPSGGRIYAYDQNFIPIGIRGTVYLTSFVNENLFQGKMKLDKWDIYLIYLGGVVFNKTNEHFERSSLPDDRIDYTFYRRDEDINFNAGILTGVTYYPLKKIGLFVELGVGPIGNLNVGVKTKI